MAGCLVLHYPLVRGREIAVELTLTPMTAADLARLLVPLQEGYANDLAVHRGVTLESARQQSADQIRESLPAGVATEGALLRLARVGDTQVGWIWVAMPKPGESRAWIYNVEVDPAYRGQGHARRIIQLIEAELAQLGVPELGLNVFGTNTVAIGLYRSLGFEVSAQQMAKRIDPAR
ncbi:GNAT family N-acetyltransferase [Micromonospora sp. WMMD1120]|uniref:GNAT family N-acetyltransferase n=1 Tax=Micromonospora sp. WMMD1120 TaxID=3016106 RepID=UPI0024179A45|nr:GNAT family N-acetyltransferase [Micromonospora sp. WMMD1120]MDG4805506.1 GNAT family N-acetyltransferase [Micromonospora sp. WMMD1120]